MQPFLGPPASPIPMQPFAATGSRFLGPATSGFFQSGAQAATGFPGQAAAFATRGAGGGFLSRLLGVGRLGTGTFGGGGLNLATILENTQRVMGITQQVAPMIQQYGPIIRNVPTLWRMMRAMPSLSTEEPDTSTEQVLTQKEPETLIQIDTEEEEGVVSVSELPRDRKRRSNEDGLSKPKLYV